MVSEVNGIMLVSSFSDVTLQCDFPIDFLATIFTCGDSGVRVATFFEKLAHFLA